MVKAKQKTIRIAMGLTPDAMRIKPDKFARYIHVPLLWAGKWVAINNNHWATSLNSEPQIMKRQYVITHRKTGYRISIIWEDMPLRKVRAIAEKLDALGAGCWDFTRPRTTKTKQWQSKYKPMVFKILGKE